MNKKPGVPGFLNMEWMNMKKEYIEKIEESDLILIGIGSEFEALRYICEERAVKALVELKNILEKKNYFMITTCTNNILLEAGLPKDRMVAPCGNLEVKQCSKACQGTIQQLTAEERQYIRENYVGDEGLQLGVCPNCGAPMILNNVYASEYDEEGYLADWRMYTKWLQGTLNKKLCVLELGVDLTFPNIIRWPFEKVAFYNQKALFIRVNEKLYHMSEELKDKGIAVNKKSIDWLLERDI